MIQFMREVHISTTVYSQVLIYTAELEQCRVKKPVHGCNNAHRIRTRVLLVENQKIYP